MTWTDLHAKLLGSAFQKVLGKPDEGAMAFVRCLTPDVVKSLASDALAGERVKARLVLHSGLLGRWPYENISQILLVLRPLATLRGGSCPAFLARDAFASQLGDLAINSRQLHRQFASSGRQCFQLSFLCGEFPAEFRNSLGPWHYGIPFKRSY